VRPRLGDGISLLPLVEPPDRIILDYPQGADAAYQAALLRIRAGGTTHYYAIMETAAREERVRTLIDAAKSIGREAEVLAVKEVHGWSPVHKLFAFDVRVS
jgi:tRNA G37 N-methylase Trm5